MQQHALRDHQRPSQVHVAGDAKQRAGRGGQRTVHEEPQRASFVVTTDQDLELSKLGVRYLRGRLQGGTGAWRGSLQWQGDAASVGESHQERFGCLNGAVTPRCEEGEREDDAEGRGTPEGVARDGPE